MLRYSAYLNNDLEILDIISKYVDWNSILEYIRVNITRKAIN